MATVRKNGKAYDSGDVVISMLGSIESEVKEISYSTDQEHQRNYSLNNNATSWSRGKVSHSGSITLYMNSVRKLEAISDGNILNIAPFDIIVTFTNEFNEIVTDKVTCKFQSTGREVNGDMGLAYQHELFVLGIAYKK